MDYTVGSLADLISGSDTPNKPKVVKKKFKKNEVISEVTEDLKPDDLASKKKDKSQKKSKKRKADDESLSENQDKNVESKIEKKKRKLDKKQADLADSGDEKPTENDQNAERRVKNKDKKEKKAYDPEELARTIFVGNVPITTTKKMMKKHFKKYGPIESLRFRGIPVANPKHTKKVAVIKKEFNPNRNSILCYIRFANQDDAVKAEAENGALFEDRHLRVHTCNSEDKPDESKAIFVGNLCFDAEEEDLWKLFEPCGQISHVRIIRDSRTGMGKGFAYVNFQDSDAVQLALGMENVKLKNREIRIALSNLKTAKKNKKQGKSKVITKPGKPKFNKPFGRNNNSSGEQADENSGKQKWFKKGGSKEKSEKQQNNAYQGTKFSEKKKNKRDKGALEKKWKIKKIAPHSK